MFCHAEAVPRTARRAGAKVMSNRLPLRYTTDLHKRRDAWEAGQTHYPGGDDTMASDPNSPREPVPRIDSTFRNGSLTAMGIVLGFSLGFTVQWATDDSPWMVTDYIEAVALALGVGLQIKALAEMLEVNSLDIPVYQRAKNRFMLGLLVTAFGIALMILINVLSPT
jgi:hypothetical protein